MQTMKMCNMMLKTRTNHFQLISLTMFIIVKVNCQKGPCTDNSITGCCAGTAWDISLGKCVECRPGYVGFQCDTLCPYPYHGKLCSSTCNCSKYECDPSVGCVDDTTGQNTYSIQSSTFDFSSRPAKRLNSSACGFSIPTYGIIIIVLCLRSVKCSHNIRTIK
ncbi:cell death abnormality protein 1-like isoform X2 [Ostrea edulis]|uniref:cell death abnormality protein 1-like isoform X2 n=1 Tax=Ostrea edulis TaxID=37623 RepID=UPI0024AF3EC8|nr:cell death abnormality protein 1-like isoform X2 [Ostrea edulis]